MFLRDHFLFRPRREVEGTPADVGLVHEDVFLATADGPRIHAWWIPHEEAALSLLWFHGNAGNVGHRLGEAEQLHALGVNTLLVDYRGYGRSEGKPSEAGLYRDADAALAWLEEERGLARSRIVLYGRSLGAAVAADLAARESGLAGLVVVTPFTSLRDVAPRSVRFPGVRWLAGKGFDVERRIAEVDLPVLVVQGGADTLTPPEMGRRIHAAAPEPKTYVEVPGGGHMSTHLVGEPAGFGEDLRTFLADAVRRES